MIKGESYVLKSLRIKASEYDSCKENRTPYTVEQYKSKLLIDYIDKLQNNWNELKKCIGEWITYHSVCDEDYKELNVLEEVQDKMQELEGNNE